MLSVADARARILASLAPTGAETVALAEAAGRVLASAVHARIDQPPRDVSAMDGYALRGADGAAGATLAVVGEAPAGRPFAGAIGAGEALRLFTGSVLPEGADAILIQENARRDGDALLIDVAVEPGRHIRRQGGDFARGDALLAPGTLLHARAIGLAAAADHPFLTVRRRPRVALLATGDEIVLPGEPIPPGGLPSSNSFAMAALLRHAGAEAVVLPVVPDRLDAIADAAASAADCDMLVTLGGASVGDHDLVRPALARHGFSPEFWKIAMRPGKPMMHGVLRFGTGRGVSVLGLPGNPVSSLVCAALFLLPAVERLLGLPGHGPAPRPVRLGAAVPVNDARADHLRATVAPSEDGIPVATPFPIQDSARLQDFARAGALVLRAPHAAALPAGAIAPALLLDALGI